MYKAIADNKRNTVLIMAIFIAIIGAIGWFMGYYYGDSTMVYYVLIGAVIYALIQYFAASSLAVAMSGARQIEKRDNPRLYRTVENISIANGMPMPKVYVIDDSALNAFATGRDPDHAIVAATSGLIDIMSDSELEAVMAHEMGHVKNYDIRVSMIAFGLASVIGILTDIGMRMMWFSDGDDDDRSPVIMILGIVLMIIAPILAVLIQMAVSRQREFLADATSAMTTRHPDAMISALQKIKSNSRPMKRQNPAMSHMYISNPLKPGSISKLFSTHPPIEDRIKRLKENAAKF